MHSALRPCVPELLGGGQCEWEGGAPVVRRGDRLLGVCVPWINDSVPFWAFLCLHFPKQSRPWPCRPWGVDREPLSLRLKTKGKTLGDAGSSLLYFAHTHLLLAGGGGWGENGVYPSVCSRCPKVFPVATSATPAALSPHSHPHQGALCLVHTGILPRCCLSEPEKGVGATPQRQDRQPPGTLPHQPFASL